MKLYAIIWSNKHGMGVCPFQSSAETLMCLPPWDEVAREIDGTILDEVDPEEIELVELDGPSEWPVVKAACSGSSRDDFRRMLMAHDWFYHMSDDPRVYRSGEANARNIRDLAEHNDQFMDDLDAAQGYMFSGPSFGRPQENAPDWWSSISWAGLRKQRISQNKKGGADRPKNASDHP